MQDGGNHAGRHKVHPGEGSANKHAGKSEQGAAGAVSKHQGRAEQEARSQHLDKHDKRGAAHVAKVKRHQNGNICQAELDARHRNGQGNHGFQIAQHQGQGGKKRNLGNPADSYDALLVHSVFLGSFADGCLKLAAVCIEAAGFRGIHGAGDALVGNYFDPELMG